jgi:hypothetical protein
MNNNYKTGLNTDEIIKEVKTTIEFWTDTIQSFCLERVRKIRTVDIFEFVMQLAKNRADGSQMILDEMYARKGMLSKNILKSSMSEARDKVVVNIWEQVIHDISKILRKQIKTRRYFAIDGVVLSLQNAKFGGKFKCHTKGMKPQGYGSVLYDIDYGFPINVQLDDHFNERNAAIKHLDFIEEGDVVILDRGYYSKELYNECKNRGIYVVFRIKSNYFKDAWNDDSNDIVYKKDDNEYRFVKYTVKKTKYMLMTNLDSSEDNADFIKTLYHKRWNIETSFKYLKDDCSLVNLHAKTIRHLNEEFCANFLLLSLSRLLEYHSINKSNYDIIGGEFNRNVLKNTNINGKHELRVNFKKCISLVNKFIHEILTYQIDTFFDRISGSIMLGLSAIRPGRHFERISKSPINKWNTKKRNENREENIER